MRYKRIAEVIMKATTSLYTILSIAGLAFTMGACGGGGSNNTPPPAAGVSAIGTCVQTPVGLLPQGTCPAGQGQVVVAGAGYPVGQCVQSTGVANTGYNGQYPGGQYPGGQYPGGQYGYNPGLNQGYYGGGQNLGLGGTQCSGQSGVIGQPGVNGIGTGQCIPFQGGCLYQGTCPMGTVQYTEPGTVEMVCAPYSTFGIQGNVGLGLPGVAPMPIGYYPPGGYVAGGGGNFGGYYGFRTW
jgi:hypothetical protein